MYDEEAVYQDDDILQFQYEEESRRISRLRKLGVCVHSSAMGKGDGRGPLEGGAYYPEQVALKPGEFLCTDGCGRVFESEDAFDAAVEAALR